MTKKLWFASLTALSLCACAPQAVRLQDGTTGYRIGCLSSKQCKTKAEAFCHGPYRTVDQQFGSSDVSRRTSRMQTFCDHITNTCSTTELPVSDVDTIATGTTIVQCAATAP